MSPVVGKAGEIHTEQQTFSNVSFVAEHVPERHDPDPSDKSVEMIDLPGMVNVYLVIDGGKLLFSQFPASSVLEAIDAGKHDAPAESKPKPPKV